jgi:hypothetical protein
VSPAGASVHSLRRYVFEAPVETVWDGIGRVGEYRTWWPWLARFEGNGLVAGDTWSMEVRPQAPYRLAVAIRLDLVEPPWRTEAEVSGDVVGTASLSLAEHGSGCELVVDSTLVAVRPLVRWACGIVPGLAARSHAAVLDAGCRQFAERGLGVGITVGPHPGC